MRNLTSGMQTALSSNNVIPALLAELFFDSGTVRLWTGIGTLNWGERQFLGGGNLVSLSQITENQGMEAKGIVASLNGIPSNLIATVLSENQRGRPFRLYLGVVQTPGDVLTESDGNILLESPRMFTSETGEQIVTESGLSLTAEGNDGGVVVTESELVDSPYRIFNGLMDTMEITDTGENSSVNITVESIMIVGQRPKLRRYTLADQQKYYPNDTGLKFINVLQDKEVVW